MFSRDRIAGLLLAAVIALAAAEDKPRMLTILHTSDLHGHATAWHGWEGELLGLGFSHVWPVAIALAWFVPLGLVFAAITDSCAMRMLLAKMWWNRRSSPACSLMEARAWFWR
ncbi:MAG: hypothetical protein WBL40_04285 [Terrimicrobiaceae bacterium]|jgi:hypothetical protein